MTLVQGTLAMFVSASTLLALAAPVETFLVLESRGKAVDSMPKGTLIARGSPFELPADAEIVLLADTGELRTIRGPVSNLPFLEASAAPNLSALQSLGRILFAERSGRPIPLGVRAPNEKAASDPWLVDLTTGGVKCVFEGAPTVLWRSGALPAVRASLEAVRGGDKEFFDWPSGAQTLPWPTNVRRAAGETYLFAMGTGSARRFDLAVARGEPERGRALLFMAENGCHDQLAVMLGDQSTSK